MHIRTNLAYGSHPRQVADIYRPRRNPTGTVIMFWHGGSWKRGNKRTYWFVGRSLARLGYTVVIPNYRLYPEVAWPVFAEDAAAAVAWVQRQFPPTRLVVMGHSAGGQIAAAVAFDPAYLAAVGVTHGIDGFIGLAGAYSFAPAPSLRPILESSGQPWQTPQLVRANPVPTLLVHGQADTVVSAQASTRLATVLREHGGRVELSLIPQIGHFKILLPFLLGWWTLPLLRRQLVDFIHSV